MPYVVLNGNHAKVAIALDFAKETFSGVKVLNHSTPLQLKISGTFIANPQLRVSADSIKDSFFTAGFACTQDRAQVQGAQVSALFVTAKPK